MKKKKEKVIAACCHCLLHNTTTTAATKEGDNITVVAFFEAKLLKKVTTIVITCFCSKAIKEGDESYHRLFLFKHKEEGNTTFIVGTTLHKKARRRRWQYLGRKGGGK